MSGELLEMAGYENKLIMLSPPSAHNMYDIFSSLRGVWMRWMGGVVDSATLFPTRLYSGVSE